MPPRAHAHGGGEEEEIVVVRTDGPPFVDLKASPGKGFEADFDKVTKYLGPGKVCGSFPLSLSRTRRLELYCTCTQGTAITYSSHSFSIPVFYIHTLENEDCLRGL